MPVDPSIYNLIRPVQIEDRRPSPFERMGAMMQLRNMMDTGQLNALQRRQLETQMGEEAAFKSAIADWAGSGGQGPLPAAALAASPTLATAFEKTRLEGEKSRAELLTRDRENWIAFAKESRDRLPTLTPETWPAYRDEQIQRAGMFATPQMREQALRGAMSIPAQFDPNFIRNATVKAEELFVPKPQVVERPDGSKVSVDMNPFTNPGILRTEFAAGMTPAQKATVETTRRGQDISAETTRRGQDLVEARERDPKLARNLAAAKEFGKAGAEAAMQLPDVIAKGQQGIQLIDHMLGSEGKALKPGETKVAAHPGFRDYVGATYKPGARYVPGSAAADFEAMYKQITGQAFLQAFQSLKGGGHITEIEGQKGTEAITRMNKSQSEREFVKAAREFQDIIRTGMERARAKAGAAAPGAAAPSGAAGGIRFLGFEGQ